jgi:hypothetical protein
MLEGQGERNFDGYFVGNDALELDRYMLYAFSLELPEYLGRLFEDEQRLK